MATSSAERMQTTAQIGAEHQGMANTKIKNSISDKEQYLDLESWYTNRIRGVILQSHCTFTQPHTYMMLKSLST